MAGALFSLSGCAAKVVLTWTATNSTTSASLGATSVSANYTKTLSYSLGTGAGAANQIYAAIISIAASGSTTIDLSAAFTNIVNNAAATWTRIKTIVIQLLSTTDDATNGTACASITVGNAASNQFISVTGTGFLASATSVFDVPNGGFMAFGVGNAAGIVVDSTHKSLKILNNDGSLAAAVQITLIGADA